MTLLPHTSKLLLAMRDFFIQQGLEKTYWIAYSGGLDSHVLLSLCHELHQELLLKLHVIHINHGISTHAEIWAEHCAHVCDEYGIHYHERVIQLECKKGESLEDIARKKRYALFAEYLNQNDILLTAHQQDDQAETVLTQLMRGAGLKGLSAMPSIKPFANGYHARPLLFFPRSSLEDYAYAKQLKWIEDESNQNTQFSRNFIRHDILPLLKTRWPTVTKTLSRSAKHCARAQELLNINMLERLSSLKGTHEKTLSVSKLLQLNHEQQKLMLRAWIEQFQYPVPSEKKLTAIQQNVLHAGFDRMPCVKWQQVEVRRYRDNLYLQLALSKHDDTQVLTWNMKQPLVIPGLGILRAKNVLGQGLKSDIKQVSVQFRRGGEVLHLGKRGHHTLKNLFQEWGVPSWMRTRIPLITIKDKVVNVTGYFVDSHYCAKEGEEGLEIILEASFTDNHYPFL